MAWKNCGGWQTIRVAEHIGFACAIVLAILAW